MADERDNRNTGVLFPQEEKENPKWPDFNGSMTDSNGTEFWIKGWKHRSKKDGAKYVSLVFEEKEAKKNSGGKKGTDKKASKDDPW